MQCCPRDLLAHLDAIRDSSDDHPGQPPGAGCSIPTAVHSSPTAQGDCRSRVKIIRRFGDARACRVPRSCPPMRDQGWPGYAGSWHHHRATAGPCCDGWWPRRDDGRNRLLRTDGASRPLTGKYQLKCAQVPQLFWLFFGRISCQIVSVEFFMTRRSPCSINLQVSSSRCCDVPDKRIRSLSSWLHVPPLASLPQQRVATEGMD